MKCYVIAEIASNWEGSIAKAKKLIQASKNSGADAVKFQMWRASDLYASSHPNWKEIKKSELTYRKIEKLKQTADEIGIEFFCSAFYPEAIEFLEKLSVKRYKIASRTCLMKDPFSKETLQKKVSETERKIFEKLIKFGAKILQQSIQNPIKKMMQKWSQKGDPMGGSACRAGAC